MKRFWLLLFFCLTVVGAQAQGAPVLALDNNGLELARRVVLPGLALFLLGSFVLAAIKQVLNYLLKRQIVAAAVSESIVERLLPGPRAEQDKIVKWLALLLSTGGGLLLCTWYGPVGIYSVIILTFSTALGFLAYYLYLLRRAK
ncbi:hypothetical protein [Hymenobacter nivis]|uniref:DUF2178 domain-containing protein n=1 Tax=Hymenobacter nivis TaxID=1850093 RepID=A0A502GDN9_9BACT|nr:hypothetical protein [Hymenobacter nivis]TPG60219.1 hypothetical protein EAH73_21100 [Hymenobacter nivis]